MGLQHLVLSFAPELGKQSIFQVGGKSENRGKHCLGLWMWNVAIYPLNQKVGKKTSFGSERDLRAFKQEFIQGSALGCVMQEISMEYHHLALECVNFWIYEILESMNFWLYEIVTIKQFTFFRFLLWLRFWFWFVTETIGQNWQKNTKCFGWANSVVFFTEKSFGWKFLPRTNLHQ